MRAEKDTAFRPLGPREIRYRASFYADALVVFVIPHPKDLQLLRAILETFAGASGLHTNINLVTQSFPCQLVHFPCKYLGIPLSIYKLKKTDLQPLVDAVADRLPTWKGRLLSRVGRSTLTQVTLTAIPIYLNCYRAINALNKLFKAFLWTGTKMVSTGKCLVAWSKVTRPKDLGGWGILDLTTLGYVLRLRWEWLRRTNEKRIWISLPCKTERIVQQMFQISFMVQVGNGARTLFWVDRWLGPQRILCLEYSVPLTTKPGKTD